MGCRVCKGLKVEISGFVQGVSFDLLALGGQLAFGIHL